MNIGTADLTCDCGFPMYSLHGCVGDLAASTRLRRAETIYAAGTASLRGRCPCCGKLHVIAQVEVYLRAIVDSFNGG